MDESVAPEAMRVALSEGEWGRALTMALHMNEAAYIKEACNAVPVDSIDIVARTVPRVFVPRLLEHVASALAQSRAVKYHVAWASCLMKAHGGTLKQRAPAALSALRGLLKPLQHHAKRLGSTGSDNTHMLQLLTHSHGAPVVGAAGADAGLAGPAGGELLVPSLLPSLGGIRVHAALLQQQAAGDDTAPADVLGGLEFDAAGQLRAREASDSEEASGSDSDAEMDTQTAAAAAGSDGASSASDSDAAEEHASAASGDSDSEGESDEEDGDGDEEEEAAPRPRSRFVAHSASEAEEDEEESGASTEDEGAYSDASAGAGRPLAHGEWREGHSEQGSSGSSADEDASEPEGSGPSDSDGSDGEGGSAGEQDAPAAKPAERGRAAAVVEDSSDEEGAGGDAGEDSDSDSSSSAASGAPIAAEDVANVFKGGDWEVPPAKSAHKRPARRGRAAGSTTAGGDPAVEATIASAVAFFGAPMQELALHAAGTPGKHGGAKRARGGGGTPGASASAAKAPRSGAKAPASSRKSDAGSAKKRAKTPPGVRRSGRLRK